MHAKPGDRVVAGQPLFTLHTATPERFDRALESLEGAWSIGPADSAAAVRGPIVRERITA